MSATELVLTNKRPKPCQDFILCPVTALAFFTSGATDGRLYLVAGEDAYLKVYDVETTRLCGQLRVFESQAIHGIHVGLTAEPEGGEGNDKPGVLVWGHRLVTVLSRDDVETLIRGGSVPTPVTATAPDWIFDGAISPRNATSGVLVTAHNEVIALEISQDDRSLRFGALQSPSRPILYSASVRWLPEEEGSVLVAGGTVFGEIIVWKCHLASSGAGRCEELFVFTGHEGSIFGVDISPEIEPAPGVKVRLLASCSDDRTVRVWDITERPVDTSESPGPSSANKTEVARETGFGNNAGEIMQSQHPSRVVASVMGHISRIWKVKFSCPDTAPAPGTNIDVYSFGEDTTTQRWHLSIDARAWAEGGGADHYPSTLKHEETLKSHSGKHIWAAAVLPQEHDEPVIATGGADGEIALIGRPGRKISRTDAPLGPRNGVKQTPRTQLLTVTVSEALKQTIDGLEDEDGEDRSLPAVKPSKKSPKKDGDSFKVYAFISEDRLLAITVQGRLLLGSFDNHLSWTEIALPEETQRDLASYSVLKSPGLGIAFLGSASGSVYMYTDSSSVTKLADFSAKIANLSLLPGPGKVHGTPSDQTAGFFGAPVVRVLATILGQQQATILAVNSLTGQVLQGGGRSLPLEEGFSVTSAAVCGVFLVLGSRRGSIALYRELEDGNFMPLTSIKLEAQDAVTSFVPLPGQARRSNPFFLATARDGKYRIYEIDDSSENNTALRLRNATSPPLGLVLEGAQFEESLHGQPELILSGFRSKNFIIWNESRREEVANVECGGAHRHFTYHIHPGQAEQLRFVFTNKSRMHVYAQTHARHSVLKRGTHGREIRAASSCGEYVATGAEDTTIRIWRYQDAGGDELGRGLHCLAVMEKHTTGIQCLRWHGPDRLVSSAGNEELFVWRVSRLASGLGGLAVFCEAVYPDRTADGDLRITDFDVQGYPGDDAVPGEMLISLVLSNSTLKTYRYSTQGGFVLLCQGQYTGACLTQIRHLRCDAGRVSVLTASTDGRIAIWSSKNAMETTSEPLEFSLVLVAKLHQSAIKSLDLCALTSPSTQPAWLIVTGGDDNALGWATLQLSQEKGDYGIVRRSLVKSAHAAAVTGVSIVGNDGISCHVVTISNDQRVRTWLVGHETSTSQRVTLLEDRPSSVADAGAIETISSNGRVLIAGVGVEVWILGP